VTLRCLFVDFNSYFASVEQYDRRLLRGRPVGVVPVMAQTTCCIAASYEAKAFGVKTGTGVREARELCPDIMLVEARPARYIELHHQLMAAIADCIPHAEPLSIDEVPCWLIGRERSRENAESIARRIKQTLRDRFDDAIHCSIGIAPNRFLAKTASDMRKPDGLTVIEQDDLPHALHDLELRDFCGIGPSMEHRLRAAGIHTAQQLCTAPREYLRAAWGSIEGERYWLQLRGFDLPERKTRRGSIGHSHVLGPELRSYEGARSVLFKLLSKAAMRLRREGFFAGGLSIRIRFLGLEPRFMRDLAFAPLDDTPTLLHLLGEQLSALERAASKRRWDPKRHPPLSVAVTLGSLQPLGMVTDSLLEDANRARKMSGVLDRINQRYGNNAVYFGAMQGAVATDAAPMRIPFSNIPEPAFEEDVVTRDRETAADDDQLWQQHLRRFKVFAEASHREADQRRRGRRNAHGNDEAPKAGAGGWTSTAPRQALIEEGGLF
jgi:DNA polymerase-4